MDKKPKIGFIGAGTVGTALAVRLSNRGYPVIAVSSRSLTSAQRLAGEVSGYGAKAYVDAQAVADTAELVFVTTPDDIIGQVVVQTHWRPGQSVVHSSGADSIDILAPAREEGAQDGAGID